MLQAGLVRVPWMVLLALLFPVVSAAYAHVSVNPRRVEAGTRHTLFFVRAPVEKEIPVVELGVEVDPEWRSNGGDLNSFEAVAGWNLTVEKDEAGKVSRVIWSGGQAPPETFQMVNMSVNVPSKPGKYPFKSWQKYSDGSVVWWNEPPEEGGGEEGETRVENPYPVVDVRAPEERRASTGMSAAAMQYGPIAVAAAALLVSLASFRSARSRG